MPNYLVIILLFFLLITGNIWLINKYINTKKTYKNKIINNIIKKLTKYSKVRQFIASFFPVFFMVFFIRSFIIEPFQIPSGSMIPTLLIGDFILVQKFSYGIKNPITNNTLISINQPNRGDIIVFQYPKNNNLNYIKRVIGLPGDIIYYNKFTKNITIIPKNINKNLHNKIFSTIHSNNINKNFTSFNLQLKQETLNNIKYNVLLLKNHLDNENMYFKQIDQKLGTWKIPNNEYFVMGDNRDNSSDSRYWGFVPEKNLIGKAIIIWMNITYKNNTICPHITFNRIGSLY